MTRFGTTFLVEARRVGAVGVVIPLMDVFKKNELRELWLAGILNLQGDFAKGGRLFITEKGKRFVDAHKEDWD